MMRNVFTVTSSYTLDVRTKFDNIKMVLIVKGFFIHFAVKSSELVNKYMFEEIVNETFLICIWKRKVF